MSDFHRTAGQTRFAAIATDLVLSGTRSIGLLYSLIPLIPGVVKNRGIWEIGWVVIVV